MATLDELLSALKDEHGIDVRALEAQASVSDAAALEAAEATELSRSLSVALSNAGVVDLPSGQSLTPADVIGAVAELAQSHLSLSAKMETLEQLRAEADVDLLISQGRILAAEKDARVELKLTNSEMFDKLLPGQPIVPIGQETGKTPPEHERHEKFINDEIARLTGPGGAAEQYIKV